MGFSQQVSLFFKLKFLWWLPACRVIGHKPTVYGLTAHDGKLIVCRRCRLLLGVERA